MEDIEVTITATEICTVALTEADLDEIRESGQPITRETIRAKAIEIFEMPDFAERDGVHYETSFDTSNIPDFVTDDEQQMQDALSDVGLQVTLLRPSREK